MYPATARMITRHRGVWSLMRSSQRMLRDASRTNSKIAKRNTINRSSVVLSVIEPDKNLYQKLTIEDGVELTWRDINRDEIDTRPSAMESMFAIKQLQEFCKHHGLSPSGSKSALVERIREYWGLAEFDDAQELKKCETRASLIIENPLTRLVFASVSHVREGVFLFEPPRYGY
jgi:hypothetical protein